MKAEGITEQRSGSPAAQSVNGADELRACREHPECRSGSPLSSLVSPPGPARLFSWISANAPRPPQPIRRPASWIGRRLSRMRIPGAKSAGTFLLQRGVEIEMLRGAMREAGSWRVLKQEFGLSLPVLLYHRVGAPRAGTNALLTVPPEEFERQMRWLAGRGCVGIRPADWLAWCREGKALPQKPVLITFDDGYADLGEHALPVIRRLGFGAAVYVVTGRLGGRSAWDDKLGFGSHPLMTAEQIGYWAGRGIDFGAHSRSHPDLTVLDDDALGAEVEGSAEDLARLLGRRPVSFAYPYGIHNTRVRERVARSFDLALSCEPGRNSLLTDLHQLRRAEILPGDGVSKFVWRLYLDRLRPAHLRQRLRLRSRGKSALHKMRAAAGF
jgi:peptidoglycan/xylan/chitin deacetylase (PgdA/CDA1 family)